MSKTLEYFLGNQSEEWINYDEGNHEKGVKFNYKRQ